MSDIVIATLRQLARFKNVTIGDGVAEELTAWLDSLKRAVPVTNPDLARCADDMRATLESWREAARLRRQNGCDTADHSTAARQFGYADALTSTADALHDFVNRLELLARRDEVSMEAWHGAVDSASELFSNAPDQRYASRASQVVTYLKTNPPAPKRDEAAGVVDLTGDLGLIRTAMRSHARWAEERAKWAREQGDGFSGDSYEREAERAEQFIQKVNVLDARAFATAPKGGEGFVVDGGPYEVPTYAVGLTGGSVVSSCKVFGRLVRVEKGYWSNAQQDWRANLFFDSGVVVQSEWWYSDDVPALLAAAAPPSAGID